MQILIYWVSANNQSFPIYNFIISLWIFDCQCHVSSKENCNERKWKLFNQLFSSQNFVPIVKSPIVERNMILIFLNLLQLYLTR